MEASNEKVKKAKDKPGPIKAGTEQAHTIEPGGVKK
jgi:hypothetical protein